MTVEIDENPAGLKTITVGCKVCHAKRSARRSWKMHSKSTLRKGEPGILHSWAYACLTCVSLVVVRWWEPTPSEQMFPVDEEAPYASD